MKLFAKSVKNELKRLHTFFPGLYTSIYVRNGHWAISPSSRCLACVCQTFFTRRVRLRQDSLRFAFELERRQARPKNGLYQFARGRPLRSLRTR